MRQLMNESQLDKVRMSHYDIYIYKGWTLREVQDKQIRPTFDNVRHRWENAEFLKTTIVWGCHQKCGVAGFIVITAGKACCHKCNEKMPPEVFENLRDAMELMKGSLDNEAEPGTF